MNANFYKHFEMYKFSNFYYGLVKQIKFKSKIKNRLNEKLGGKNGKNNWN